MKKKTKRKPTQASIRRKKLKEWSLRVRNNAGNVCEVCGKAEYLNAHHVLPKERYQPLQFIDINGVALCPSHHKYGKLSAHRNAIWFAEWLKEKHPEKYQWSLKNLGAE